jgi:hypothetical protein
MKRKQLKNVRRKWGKSVMQGNKSYGRFYRELYEVFINHFDKGESNDNIG